TIRLPKRLERCLSSMRDIAVILDFGLRILDWNWNPKSAIQNPKSSKQSLDPVNRQIPLLQQLREEEVQDDDSQEAGDEAFGARPADAAGAAGAREALVATDQADRAAEEEALVDAFHDLPSVDRLGGVCPVGLLGDAEEFRGDDPPAQDAQQVAVNREDR